MTTGEASTFLRVLAKVPQTSNGSRAWDLVDPGTLPWMLRQGVELGLLKALLADPELLVYADPARLLSAIDESDAHDDPDVAVYRHDAARLQRVSPTARRQLLTINAARYGHRPLVASLTRDHVTPVPWVPTWFNACERTRSLYRAMTTSDSEIEHIACERLGQRLIVAALNADGVVSAWDALREEPYGLPWLVRDHQVGSLAMGSWSGRAFAVVGTRHGQVLVHDILTGEALPSLGFDALGGARVAAATSEQGPVVAAVAFSDQGTGELRVWAVTTRRELVRYVHPTASLVSVTTVRTRDGVVFVVGDFSGRVGFVGLDERSIAWQEREHATAVAALAAGVVGGRPLVVSTDVFGEMIVWDPIGRAALDLRIPLSRRGSPPVAITGVGDVPSLVVGSSTGIRRADLVEATVEDRSTGNSWMVTAVAAVRSRGRDLAVVGGGGQVQLFDLGLPDPVPQHSPRAAISTVAAARLPRRPLVITVDTDSEVRVVDAGTGQFINASFATRADWAAPIDGTPWVALASYRGHADFGPFLVNVEAAARQRVRRNRLREVSCLAAARMGEQFVVASGSRSGEVEVWSSGAGDVYLFSPHEEELTVSKLEFTTWNDSLILVSGSADGTIAWIDVLNGRVLGRHTAHGDAVTALATRGLTAISGSYSGDLCTWYGLELTTRRDDAHSGAVKAIAMPGTPRPSFVSSGDDAMLNTWSLEDATLISSMAIPSPIQAMAATGQGLVAAMGRELLRLRSHAAS